MCFNGIFTYRIYSCISRPFMTIFVSVKVVKFEIKRHFQCILIFYYIKQIDSMLPCVCSLNIDHRGRPNVLNAVVAELQSWTNFFGTLAFISVKCIFFGLQMPPPPPQLNVGHKLVHFQPCTLFSVYFPQATLNGGVGGPKEPRICDKK